MSVKLSEEQVAVYLSKLMDWRYERQSLVRTYGCRSFREAAQAAAAIAELAELADHHPDLSIQERRLTVSLTTRDCSGVTGKDFCLAQQIDALLLPTH
ncbi:putative pterin-4-alpha-carbinolamine dehydratase [Paenibacillus sp. J31TS4]|uniref:4a-hydroxytetrahydrobiopterin dehydratase n=1 Tax=Paenibacillus sp. J31TS4 TaxID=2807195 RepID=UPI001B0CD8BA|nr:4a-hydroxytetrahydrobiopterin dehydratase [Paenibacillus sp. J31TS4]GIP39636.1 putative pterin-4-alpha-carbinolamine dehydratase [Paenibacillus sp. J31TS4]